MFGLKWLQFEMLYFLATWGQQKHVVNNSAISSGLNLDLVILENNYIHISYIYSTVYITVTYKYVICALSLSTHRAWLKSSPRLGEYLTNAISELDVKE